MSVSHTCRLRFEEDFIPGCTNVKTDYNNVYEMCYNSVALS